MSSPTGVFVPTWTVAAVFAGIAVLCALVGGVYLRRLQRTGRAAGTWPSFLVGPGALQLAALTSGMLLSSIASLAGPWGEVRSEAASLMHWQPQLKKGALFTTSYIDVQRYRYVGVFGRVQSPENGTATVIVYGIDANGRSGEVRRLEIAAGKWTVWQSRITARQLRLIVDHPHGEAQTDRLVDLALILDQAPPQRLSDTLLAPPPAAPATGTQ